ncbi:hypothetical protein F5882DRAFT_145261 [Hyaloscypha sp. PMI_1271]|nr:hypothetical protein F5882DRAFT_145261 [Hyaloscypha sp. PMI_1271]
MIPAGSGFTVQNRGSNLNLGQEDHPNTYEWEKRPYRTIIPGTITHGERWSDNFTRCLGSWAGCNLYISTAPPRRDTDISDRMHPQGHAQLLLSMEMCGMDPHQALDAPRVCVGPSAPGGGDPAVG